MDLVFVYGTLKRNESNHHLLSSSLFVKEAVTAREYLIYDFGPYPCMVKVPHGEGKNIFGEIYEVTEDVLSELDYLEGVSEHHYERERVHLLKFLDPVWTYLYLRDVSKLNEVGNYWTKDRR